MNPIPTPWKHQSEVLQQTWSLPAYGLFWEMGAGKSRTLVETAFRLWDDKKVDRVLLISDKGCYRGFKDQVWLFFPRITVPICDVAVWPKLPPKNCFPVCWFFLMNIDALKTASGYAAAEAFVKGGPTLMIIDESTSIKNHKAQRTKAAMKLGRFCPYRRIATGTPMPNGPDDLWGQCEFLQPGSLGHKSFFSFHSYYSILKPVQMGNRRFNKVVGHRCLDELQESIKPFTSRILKKDCLDLPEKIYETIEVDQTPEQKEAYRSLKDEAILQLGKGLLTVTSALTLVSKLHQINCGHVRDNNGNANRVPSARISVLAELLEKVEGKALIWAHYREDMVLLRETFGGSAVFYCGDTSAADREASLERFKDDGTARLFIGSPSCGGKGINGLTVASTCIYYSNSWNLEHRLQSEDRLHRPPQKNNVTYIDLVCPGTVDEKIVKALKAKQDLSTKVLDEIRELLK